MNPKQTDWESFFFVKCFFSLFFLLILHIFIHKTIYECLCIFRRKEIVLLFFAETLSRSEYIVDISTGMKIRKMYSSSNENKLFFVVQSIFSSTYWRHSTEHVYIYVVWKERFQPLQKQHFEWIRGWHHMPIDIYFTYTANAHEI